MLKNAGELFALAVLKTVDFQIPGTDKKIRLRELTAGHRGQLLEITREAGNPVETQARLMIFSCVDENGTAMFTESDLSKLLEMKHSILDAISVEILKLSGLDATAKK